MDLPVTQASENRQKQAACLECRKSKTKCIRVDNDAICRKCKASDTACVVPPYHVGRYKGVKNKRSGLEKAISQIEKAVKRSRSSDAGLDESQTRALKQLLHETDTSAETDTSTSVPPPYPNQPTHSPIVQQTAHRLSAPVRHASFASQSEDAGDLTVNNADNPLQLLAIASAIPEPSPTAVTPSTNHRTPLANGDPVNVESETQAFFRPLRSKLDVSPDMDPILLGLVEEYEAERMLTYFYQKLAHTRWGMDSSIHTVPFIRSRSALLLTSVLAASALFSPDAAGLSKRLHNHVRKLVRNLVLSRYRSVEIVLALMINVPWMAPGNEWAADDDTCYYISLALTIALDLSINKIITPSSVPRPHGVMERVSKTECIDARKALSLDGFHDLDPSSQYAKRILRTRERVWLSLFNLDRGVCLARGRSPTVPRSALVDTCDSWHICELAEKQDGALVSATVLRRSFAGLVDSIRNTCDSNQLTIGEDSTTIRRMRDRIEECFEEWYGTWRFQIQLSDGSLPPYVEILASHTKLSAYCSVIDHPTAPPDVKQFFRTAGLASALNVLKVAVQAERSLVSMPNNTVIMVSFAAFFVLGLSHSKSGSASLMAPNTRCLIENLSDVLQRIGSSPPHRNGASIWFGRHIKSITERSFASASSPGHQRKEQSNKTISQMDHNFGGQTNVLNIPSMTDLAFDLDGSGHGMAPEQFPILDMTNDQIIEAITNSKDQIDEYNANYPFDESLFLECFDPWG